MQTSHKSITREQNKCRQDIVAFKSGELDKKRQALSIIRWSTIPEEIINRILERRKKTGALDNTGTFSHLERKRSIKTVCPALQK